MKRRDFGKATIAAGVGLTATTAFAGSAAAATGAPLPVAGRAGSAHVVYLRSAVTRFTTAGYHIGAAELVGPAVRTYQGARALLDSGDYNERLGIELASVAGELAECAGWQAYDSGDHRLARQCYNEALILAQHSGDTDLAVRTLSSMTRQSCHLVGGNRALSNDPRAIASGAGMAREASRLSQRASDLSRGLPRSTVLAAHLAAREAIAAAAVGDTRGFELAMMQAWREADRGLERSDQDPPWLQYLTASEITAHEAKGLRYLGQHRKAVEKLTDVVANGDDLPLYRTQYRSYLAAALTAAGDNKRAMTEGLAVLDQLEGQVKSTRLLTELRPVRAAATRSRADGAAEFQQRYDRLLTSV